MTRKPSAEPTAAEALASLLGEAGDAIGRADAEAWAQLGDALAPVAPRPLARGRVLRAALGAARLSDELRTRLRALFALSEAAVDRLVARMNRGDAWASMGLPGVDVLLVSETEPSAANALVRIEPATEFPHHRHVGDEEMLVLEGALTTDGGVHHGVGARLVSAPGSAHAFRVDAADECICAIRLGDGVVFG